MKTVERPIRLVMWRGGWVVCCDPCVDEWYLDKRDDALESIDHHIAWHKAVNGS